MQLLSVNIGHPRPNPWKPSGTTGIDKRPVDGPVAVAAPGPKGTGAVGLAGDRVFDVKSHGGDDKAVYAYAREDLDDWQRELGRELPNGTFGENLTTLGLDVNAALVGERWRIGEQVVLEVSCPRVPCGTFQGWLDRDGWIKRFTEAARPGPYLRVVRGGTIAAGDRIEVVHRPDHHEVSIAFFYRAVTTEPELLPELLTAGDALPARTVEKINARLAGPGRS
jgi:MOSC domain-containing protein YiiM